MSQFLIRGAAFGVLAGSLAACATAPTYPIANAAPSPAPVSTPSAPATLTPPATPPLVQPAEPSPAAPQAVETQTLAPIPQARQSDPEPVRPPPPPVAAAPPPSPMAAQTAAPPPTPEKPRYTAAGKVIDARKMFRMYQVRKGDHLDEIARDLETTRAILVEANHLKDPDSLRPGQRLRVPIDKAYVVQSGDTVLAVARRFGVDAADLADLNAIAESHRLRAGDELALPAVIHDTGPVLLASVRFAGRSLPAGYRPPPWALPPTGDAALRPPSAYPSATVPAATALTDAQVTAAGRGRFVWPVKGEILSSFGVKDLGRKNDGVDVRAPLGAPVHSAAAGDVVYAGDQVPGFGNLVLVKHADGWVTAYAHLEKVVVKMRDSVAQDQEIGQVGQTGGVSEPQLHFEVRFAPTPMEKARPVDPLLVLPQ